MVSLLDPDGPELPQLHVGRGEEPVHVDLGPALLSKASVSEEDNISYVLTCRATGSQLLVDAADDAPAVLALLASAAAAAGRAGSTDLQAVLTTHGHWDHHRALPEVVAATGALALVGAEDADDLPVPADRTLRHGDVVEVGRLRLDVVHLRGHTPGSVALVLPASAEAPAVALTGDSLFPGGVGNTWQDRTRFESLLADVQARLFDVLEDSTLVLPGHGDGTTLGRERPAVPVWRQRGW